jgi:hypothetical protein
MASVGIMSMNDTLDTMEQTELTRLDTYYGCTIKMIMKPPAKLRKRWRI